jgi:Cu/Ag efflux pump CusA
MIFEGDRRFAVTIRLSDSARADLQTLGQVPVPLPNGGCSCEYPVMKWPSRRSRLSWL